MLATATATHCSTSLLLARRIWWPPSFQAIRRAVSAPTSRPLSSTTTSLSTTWYCPRQHIWIRSVTKDNDTNTTYSGAAVVRDGGGAGTRLPVPRVDDDDDVTIPGVMIHKLQIGLTRWGLDDLGDVTLIELITPPHMTPNVSTASTTTTTSSRPSWNDSDDDDDGSDRGVYCQSYEKGQTCLQVHWDGFRRSEADELYHAVWDTIEGVHAIQCPVPGRVVVSVDTAAIAIAADPDQSMATTGSPTTKRSRYPVVVGDMDVEVDDDFVLAEIYCTERHWQEAASRWMTFATYQRHVQQQQQNQQTRGKFAELLV